MTTQSERELLELAAKAAGKWPQDFELGDDDLPVYAEGKGFRLAWGAGWWHPRGDDGDALRLSTSLGLRCQALKSGSGMARVESFDPWRCECEAARGDIDAAMRLAITRAAAALAKED